MSRTDEGRQRNANQMGVAGPAGGDRRRAHMFNSGLVAGRRWANNALNTSAPDFSIRPPAQDRAGTDLPAWLRGFGTGVIAAAASRENDGEPS